MCCSERGCITQLQYDMHPVNSSSTCRKHDANTFPCGSLLAHAKECIADYLTTGLQLVIEKQIYVMVLPMEGHQLR